MTSHSVQKSSDWEDQLLKCGVCFNNLRDPRLLLCLHRFCVKCIQKHMDECDGKMTCPKCELQVEIPEDGAVGFRSDFVTLSLQKDVKKRQMKTVMTCGFCENDLQVVAFCATCDSLICSTCRTLHTKPIQFFKNHTCVIDLDVGECDRAVRSGLDEGAPYCSVHPKQRTVISCATCDSKPLCSVCIPLHSKHEFEDVFENSRKMKEQVNEQLSQVKQLKKLWDVYGMQVKDGKQNTQNEATVTRDVIENTAKDKITKIDTQCEERIHQVTEQRNANINKLKEQIAREIQLKKEEIKRAKEIASKQKQDIILATETLTKSLQGDSEKLTKKYMIMKSRIDRMIDRYVNCQITTSFVLTGSNSDIVQWAPFIQQSLKQLNKDLGEEFTEIEEARQQSIVFTESDEDDEVGFLFGKPQQPGLLTLISKEGTVMTFTWTAPLSLPNAPVDSFILEQKALTEEAWTVAERDVKETKYSFKDLLPGETYQFRVSAENLAGVGPASESTLPYITADVPGPTCKPKVIMFNEKEITIEWNPPPSNGGDTITDYVVQRKTQHEPQWSIAGKKKTGTRHTVGGLISGQDYQFRVAAQNRAGLGQHSEPSDVVHHPCKNGTLLIGARVVIRPEHENLGVWTHVSFKFDTFDDWMSYQQMKAYSPGVGTVTGLCDWNNAKVFVTWAHGSRFIYNMGYGDSYRLTLAPLDTGDVQI